MDRDTMIIEKSKDKTTDGYFIYNFKKIPQNSYIKIHNLFFKSDKMAIKKAKKLNPDFEYEVKQVD